MSKRPVVVLALGVVVALVAAGGLMWKQRQDRNERCQTAFAVVQAAVKQAASGQAGGPSVSEQARLRKCLDDGWKVGG